MAGFPSASSAVSTVKRVESEAGGRGKSLNGVLPLSLESISPSTFVGSLMGRSGFFSCGRSVTGDVGASFPKDAGVLNVLSMSVITFFADIVSAGFGSFGVSVVVCSKGENGLRDLKKVVSFLVTDGSSVEVSPLALRDTSTSSSSRSSSLTHASGLR